MEKLSFYIIDIDKRVIFFNVPLSSMTLGIKNVSALGNTLREAKLEDIEAKCYLIPYLNNHKVAFPLCDSIW